MSDKQDQQSDTKLYNKNRNPVTGDRIVTKEGNRKAYEENYDKIKWNVEEDK